MRALTIGILASSVPAEGLGKQNRIIYWFLSTSRAVPTSIGLLIAFSVFLEFCLFFLELVLVLYEYRALPEQI